MKVVKTDDRTEEWRHRVLAKAAGIVEEQNTRVASASSTNTEELIFFNADEV